MALYAIDVGGPVTLEIHAEGQVYTFQGDSAGAVFAQAFPPKGVFD